MPDNWTSLSRVKAALEHKEPDRVPFDLGGSVLTGMSRHAYKRLREYLGLPSKPIEVIDIVQQLARIDDDVIERLKVDVLALDPAPPSSWTLNQTEKDGYYWFTDEFGILWRMPVQGGLYFDMYKHPLQDATSIDDLKKYKFADPVDPARFVGMAEKADRFMNQENMAYVLGRNAAGIFEVALWLRGFEEFFQDMALDPPLADYLLDMITEAKMQYWGKALETVGENVLVLSEADDLATQFSLLVSPAMYRRFISPRHKRLFDYIKQKAKSKVYIFYHSCGSVKQLIPDLIEEGVDILNPVQVNAADMDTKVLKKEFGDAITFWGGGVDTQRVLPHGTPQQVRDEVKRRIDDLAPGGGFVFSTVHNTQADVPPENYMAMWETLQEYGVYIK